MGGDIQVKSEQGKGSTFQFKIVAENVLPQAEKRKALDNLEETILNVIQKKQYKVLIVDDNIINQKVLGMNSYITKPFKSEQIYEEIMLYCDPSFAATHQQMLNISAKKMKYAG